MRCEDTRYLAKLDEGQRKTILTGYGKFFADNFVHIHGEHCYVVGPTGSGKTNKGYGLVNWLMHTETIVWISSGKENEITPLLFLGKPVRIITTKYHDIEITKGHDLYDPQPDIVRVPDAGSAWWAVKKGWINIFEFRNAFWSKENRMLWMIDLFTTLSEWTRLKIMPHISPCAIFVDEAKWIVAGTKLTNDSVRVKATEIIGEVMMDIRAYMFRVVVFVQGFTDTPPAIRENIACTVLCSGADIDVTTKLKYHCHPTVPSWKGTLKYRRNEAKFVDRFGNASPNDRPVPWPLFPKKDEDRELCRSLNVVERGFYDRPPETAEPEEECFPELGRFSASAIPPEKQEVPAVSRFTQVKDDE